MNTIKKMTIACCGLGLMSPLCVRAALDRDHAMLSAINRAVMSGYHDIMSGECTPDTGRRMENATAELERVASATSREGFWAPVYDPDNPSTPNNSGHDVGCQLVTFVNQTAIGIRRIEINPRINYGGACPQSFSGLLGPWCTGGLAIGVRNAHYDVNIVTDSGATIAFGNVFIGTGMSRLVLMQVDYGRYMITGV